MPRVSFAVVGRLHSMMHFRPAADRGSHWVGDCFLALSCSLKA